MAMMFGAKAVEAVVKRINSAKIVKDNGRDANGATRYIRAYKYEKDSDESGEYIAVNHLPFTHAHGKAVEEGTLNVNVHVPTLKSGRPHLKRIESLCYEVLELFPNDTYMDGAYYNFFCDSRPIKDNDETYFVNLQIHVTYNNLNGEEFKVNN